MGYYINKVEGKIAPTVGKTDFLLTHAKAREIPRPSTLCPDLICVVSNGFFDAAAYIYSPAELAEFSQSGDPRPKKWLIVPEAAVLADYRAALAEAGVAHPAPATQPGGPGERQLGYEAEE